MRLPDSSGALPLALILCLAAQQVGAQQSEILQRRELEFARGLALQWGFLDMSRDLLARLKQTPVSASLEDDIQAFECDLQAVGASGVADRERRKQLLKTALGDYEHYLVTHPEAQNRSRVESAYLDTALNCARSLDDVVNNSEAADVEARAKELRDTLTDVVTNTTNSTDTLRANPARTQAQTRALSGLLLDRGTLLLSIAHSQNDAWSTFAKAQQCFEQLLDVAEETSSVGLRAMVGIGEIHLALKRPLDAYDYFAFTGDVAVPRDEKTWIKDSADLSREEVQRRFALLQLATPGMIRSQLAAGHAAKACADGMRLLRIWKRGGLELIEPQGFESLLECATALSEAGGFVGGDLANGNIDWFEDAKALQAKFQQPTQPYSATEFSIHLAKLTADLSRGTWFATRAQRLASELVFGHAGLIPPQLLIEVADSKRNDGDAQGALELYKRALSELESKDPTQYSAFGPRILNAIGICYMSLGRDLEAALVFQEALTRFAADREFDAANASGFWSTAHRLEAKSKADPLIAALAASADEAKLRHPGASDGGEIIYAQAARVFDEQKDFAKARALFQSVPSDAQSFEKALVFVGVCEYELGKQAHDQAAAIKTLDGYLDNYVKDHALPSTESSRATRRTEAIATATYYRGLVESNLAEVGKSDWKRVALLLHDFEDRFPTQAVLAPAAMYRTVQALRLRHEGDVREVDTTFAKMRERFATSEWTKAAALEICSGLESEYKRAKESQDPAERAKAVELARKLAELLEFANQGLVHSNFANLRRESQLWMELGEWAKAETVLRELADQFKAGERAAGVEARVLPDLGVVLFQQQKLALAVDVLRPIVEAHQATFEVTLTYAHALSGYAELDQDQRSVRVVPGLQDVESLASAALLYEQLLQREKNREGGGAWTPRWLELKFDQIYCLQLWSKLDSKKVEVARAQIQSLQIEYDGASLPKLAETDLRSKFTWLMGQMK